MEDKKCCCGEESKETQKADSCCCHEEEKHVESSCCHEEEKHVESSCCHEEKTHDESSCCHEEAKHVESCCCHHEEVKRDESCCCHHESGAISSCCSSGASTCGCCGKEKENSLKKEIIILAVSLASLVLGFFDWHHISGGSGALAAFYYVNPAWVAVILCGAPIFTAAYSVLKQGKLKASVLISIAMLASIGLEIAGFFVDVSGGGHNHSYVFAAGEIAFLMELGELIENVTVRKCRSGIQRLASLIPKEAFVKTEGGLEKRALSEISIGDVVVVKSGEMVAVDGVVIAGEGSIDQSSVTGEYLPVDVASGDSVFGGTMNKNGVIEVRVTKLQKDMTIAKMAELVEEAEGKKAPISRLADKWAGYIVPLVFLTAIVVGLLAAFVFKVGTTTSIIRAITILVVFCPCSLVLATPTAIAAGLGNAAKNGVLIKSGASLEELSHVDTVCFDKTGTLTEGKIVLDNIVAADGNEEELLRLAASLETYSEHPLAAAVTERGKGLELYKVENVETKQGVGISGTVNGKSVTILSYKKAIENSLDVSEFMTEITSDLSLGKTVTVVETNGVAAGILSFSDTIREEAKTVIGELGNTGYRTVMLTGDNEKSAGYIAEKCNIKEVKHSLLPEEKLTAISGLQSSGKKVCMVGDGVNDAPSLKLADVSFAMGALGSDIAIDTADMAILNSDLNKLNDTLRLSKRTLNAIKRNITIAMVVNLFAVVASACGWLNPVTGALVHNCTSVLVVGSSALLLRNKNKAYK